MESIFEKKTALVFTIFFKFTKVRGCSGSSSSEPSYEYFPLYILGGLVALLFLWCFCVYCWDTCEVICSGISPDEGKSKIQI